MLSSKDCIGKGILKITIFSFSQSSLNILNKGFLNLQNKGIINSYLLELQKAFLKYFPETEKVSCYAGWITNSFVSNCLLPKI